MKITIHRGANQIGGCITEIATKDTKIFIDLGSNLPGSDKTDYTADEVRKIKQLMPMRFSIHIIMVTM